MSALQGPLSVLGRLFLVALFLSSAVMYKIPRYSEVVGQMEKQGVPLPQVSLALAIGFLLVGGVSVAFGFQARIGAALLAVFLVLATYFFHNFWATSDPAARQDQMIQFQKNLGLLGAMLFIVANGSGAWSIDRCGRGETRPAGAQPGA
jgi:putative oxidoreductase